MVAVVVCGQQVFILCFLWMTLFVSVKSPDQVNFQTEHCVTRTPEKRRLEEHGQVHGTFGDRLTTEIGNI